jgi:hypothetical protein
VKPIQITRGGRRRFIPQLQALEERLCPAFGFAASANVLTITGDQYANNVTLFDNGQGTVSAQMSTLGRKVVKTFTGIDTIRVNTLAGNDVFAYAMTGPAKKNLNLIVNLGSETNRANISLLNDIVGRRETINVVGGAANDQVWLQVGKLVNSTLNCNIALGSGNNAFNGFLNSDLLGYSAANIMVNAAGGNNLLLMNAHHVNVAQTAAINVGLQGGAGTDIISTDYLGELNGLLTVRHHGGGGNDSLTMKVGADPGSIGKIDALTAGDAGNDKMYVSFVNNSAAGPGVLHPARGRLAAVKIVADGGLGTDVLTRVGGSTIQPLNMEKVIG